MLIRPVVSVVFILLASCGPRSSHGSLKDEGLYNVETLAPEKIAEQLSVQMDWNREGSKRGVSAIQKAMLSTFLIYCPGTDYGTGFYIDNKGTFITAHHVLHTPELRCWIGLYEKNDQGYKQILYKSRIEITATRFSEFEYDYTIGKTLDVESSSFLTVTRDSGKNVPEGTQTLAFGYAAETKREDVSEGPSKLDIKKVLDDLRNERGCAALLKDRDSLRFDKVKERLSPAELADPKTKELFDWLQLDIKMCEQLLDKGYYRLAENSYQNAPAENSDDSYRRPLIVSVGKIAAKLGHVVGSTNDGGPGMSGGPLVAVETGEVVGFVTRSFPGNKTFENVKKLNTRDRFVGGMYAHKIDKNIQDKLAKDAAFHADDSFLKLKPSHIVKCNDTINDQHGYSFYMVKGNKLEHARIFILSDQDETFEVQVLLNKIPEIFRVTLLDDRLLAVGTKNEKSSEGRVSFRIYDGLVPKSAPMFKAQPASFDDVQVFAAYAFDNLIGDLISDNPFAKNSLQDINIEAMARECKKVLTAQNNEKMRKLFPEWGRK